MEVPTREQLKKKKVVELRADLSRFHLPQSGRCQRGVYKSTCLTLYPGSCTQA